MTAHRNPSLSFKRNPTLLTVGTWALPVGGGAEWLDNKFTNANSWPPWHRATVRKHLSMALQSNTRCATNLIVSSRAAMEACASNCITFAGRSAIPDQSAGANDIAATDVITVAAYIQQRCSMETLRCCLTPQRRESDLHAANGCSTI